jgi:hypothetical protein
VVEEGLSYYYIPPPINLTSGDPTIIKSKRDLTIDLAGVIILHDNISAWPMTKTNDSFVNAFHFKNCLNLVIKGGGTIQGFRSERARRKKKKVILWFFLICQVYNYWYALFFFFLFFLSAQVKVKNGGENSFLV